VPVFVALGKRDAAEEYLASLRARLQNPFPGPSPCRHRPKSQPEEEATFRAGGFAGGAACSDASAAAAASGSGLWRSMSR
jgi:hypothetical protein